MSGTLVLQNNGGDDLTLTADGAFTFATALADGSAYDVTVLTQPAGQICTITTGSGTLAGADVTNVAANCVFTAPVVSGLAWFMDINGNASCDAGDQVVVQFDQPVVVNAAGGSDLELPVTGDSFGAGATVAAGPQSDEVTVTLGASPSLKSRRTYAGATGANSPSGVDVSSSMALDAIEGLSGVDAVGSTPLDVAPAFLSSGQALGSSDSISVALGDVDGDGDLDLAVGNGSGSANRIYLNDGAGAFTDSGQALGSSTSYSVALGDVDGDGDLDIVVGNWGSPNRIFLNDGAGAFTDSGQALGSGYSYSVALGDVDSDGDLDLAVGNNNQANLIYLNDGAGAFTDSGQALGSGYSYSVALGDVDSDGDLDLAVGNYLGQANRIYLNDGAGAFTDSGQTLGSGKSHSVAFGDVDSD
ncbi:MAG: VCBS repeat-containing protein, partial [bacterium]|nr:VCBS repeat-containing protein [bacterium]